jgi:Family of unknown function (DUF5678)
MATLEQIIDEARALSPSEKRQLRQALDRDLEEPAPVPSRAKETAWIDRHRDEYLGQWVAIEGDTLIAHGNNPRQVYLAAREAGITTPFVERVDKRQDAFMGGWL